MDIADDIAYSTYDLEDNIKAGFLTPISLFSLDDKIHDAVAAKISERIKDQYPDHATDVIDRTFVKLELFRIFTRYLFVGGENYKVNTQALKTLISMEVEKASKNYASNGYLRTRLTSESVGRFVNAIEVVPHAIYPQLHTVRLKYDTFTKVEVLKNLTYYAIIRSPVMQVVQHRGRDIIDKLFKSLSGETLNHWNCL